MNLDEILTEYRSICFLVERNEGDDKAITLMAAQNLITKRQMKDFILSLLRDVGSSDPTFKLGYNKANSDIRIKVDKL